ncbi:MAG: hypothetical protein M3Z31_19500 [Pseudomonadota bacterium]|nr:hypothetical protein [Pseudomonadota bacterium]
MAKSLTAAPDAAKSTAAGEAAPAVVAAGAAAERTVSAGATATELAGAAAAGTLDVPTTRSRSPRANQNQSPAMITSNPVSQTHHSIPLVLLTGISAVVFSFVGATFQRASFD